MREVKPKEIQEALGKHDKWLNDVDGGACVNFKDANLRGANLQDVNLRDANLQDANLQGANLRGANLRGANLRNANLRNVNLRNVNLLGANLQDVNLRDANLLNVEGNMKEIKSIHIETYSVAYTDAVIQIGCERHYIKNWFELDDRSILEMDGKTALNFWKKWKPVIQQIIKLSPGVTRLKGMQNEI